MERSKTAFRYIWAMCLSAVTVLGMAVTENLLLTADRGAFLRAVLDSFVSWRGLVSFLALSALYAVGRKGGSLSAAIVAAVFSAITVVYACLADAVTLRRPSMMAFLFALICWWWLFYCLLDVLFRWMDALPGRRAYALQSGVKKHAFIYTAALLVLWMPWFVLCFPGNVAWDTGSSIIYSLGIDRTNVNNPFFQNILFGMVYRVGAALGDVDIGIFIYAMVQSCLFALCIALAMVQLEKWGTPFPWILGLLFLYGLCPCFPIYAFSVGKDSNFAIAVFCFSLLVLKLLTEGEAFLRCRKKMLCLLLSGVLMGLLRNHGVAIAVVCILISGCVFLKDSHRVPASLIGVLAGVLAVTGILPLALQIPEGTVNESLSIPLQQTAYYVNHYGDEVTEEEREVIDAVIPYEILSAYNPSLADPVKNEFRSDASDEQIAAYFRVWFRQLRKHPMAYVKALYYQTYGYYSPDAISSVKPQRQWGFNVDKKLYELTELEEPEDSRISTAKKIDEFVTDLPVIGLFQKVGIYTWALIAMAAYLISRKKYRVLVSLLPGAVVLTGCCLSPVNGYFRYAFSMIAVIPVLVPAVLYAHGTEKEGDKR